MLSQLKVNSVGSCICLLLLLLILSKRAESVGFELKSGHTKCISEDIKANSMSVGNYHIVNPNEGIPLPDSHKLTAKVISLLVEPTDTTKLKVNRILNGSGQAGRMFGNRAGVIGLMYAGLESGMVALRDTDDVINSAVDLMSAEAGDYMTCFFAADHQPPVTMTVDFEWKSGIAAKDWSNVAKKDSVEVMELELKKMFDTVQSIHDEMFYLRSREEEMQELNKATNSKMFWLSMLSLFVCISVAGLQLWHLKSFFEKKKLI